VAAQVTQPISILPVRAISCLVGSRGLEPHDAPSPVSKSGGLQPHGEKGALVLARGFEPRLAGVLSAVPLALG
jgi:hypothetical protein